MSDSMKYPRLPEAMSYCVMWHGRQVRKYSQLPYSVHPIEVMQIVATVIDDEDTLIAALLHDILEDTDVREDTIEELFGPRVLELVEWLTDVSKPEDGNRAERKAIDREELSRAPADVQTIKYADIISNMSNVWEHELSFAREYLEEKRLLLEAMTRGNSELYVRAWDTLYKYQRELKQKLN